MVGFSIPKIFNLRSILPTPVILRGAKGEVAESIIHQITLALKESSDRCRRWFWAGEEHFHTLLTSTRENLLQRKKVFFRSWIQLPSATNDDPRRIPESVFSFFHIRVKVYLLSELKEYEKYRTI